jgi:hypothetical protein
MGSEILQGDSTSTTEKSVFGKMTVRPFDSTLSPLSGTDAFDDGEKQQQIIIRRMGKKRKAS